MENLDLLVQELIKYPKETEWLEFKHNNYEPQMIGRDISALANSATLNEKSCAYMLWGINDETHEIVGTDKDLRTLKKGNQELENWLRSLLSNNADFEFSSVEVNNKTVGVLIIYSATNQTVMFEKADYIRVGSYTKKLNEYPEIQAKLWDKLRTSKFEERSAKIDLSLTEALSLLDYNAYFDNADIPLPQDANGIAHYLLEEAILQKQDNGLYTITNLGAILFAKNLSAFPKLSRKATQTLKHAETSQIKYDLIGKIAEGTVLTRKTVARILQGIRLDKFYMFRNNPEEFISKVIKLIKEQKANMVVEHIYYDQIEGEYKEDIFTADKSSQSLDKAFRASKAIQEYVFTDGTAEKSIERKFAEDLDAAKEVCVYAKLPKGFHIPTPMGNYSPDWAIAFNKGTVKHIFFIAETKGTMESLNLRPIEQAKIRCAKKLFNEISTESVRYEAVNDYQNLLQVMNSIK